MKTDLLTAFSIKWGFIASCLCVQKFRQLWSCEGLSQKRLSNVSAFFSLALLFTLVSFSGISAGDMEGGPGRCRCGPTRQHYLACKVLRWSARTLACWGTSTAGESHQIGAFQMILDLCLWRLASLVFSVVVGNMVFCDKFRDQRYMCSLLHGGLW